LSENDVGQGTATANSGKSTLSVTAVDFLGKTRRAESLVTFTMIRTDESFSNTLKRAGLCRTEYFDFLGIFEN
jgi:hypothetical protein